MTTEPSTPPEGAAAATPTGEPAKPAPAVPAKPAPAPPQGPGVVRRTTNTIKRVMLIAIGALAALFAVVNSQNVQVRWIFGHPIETPLILAIAVAFIAGAAIGWLAAKLGGRGAHQPQDSSSTLR
ncbi:MAG: LapA family protein [Solirubrobacteraceae bacterium]|nr:LapA family protein [Solirubrobacteraceae bacterium]